MSEYVLDTSAVRSIGWKVLETAAKTNTLTVSPLSLFEILCHLDAPHKKGASAEESFPIQKQQLLKCRLLQTRDDPFAEHADAVGARKLVHPTRFEDRSLIPRIFPLLEQSSSLEEFYKATLIDENGVLREVRDIAERARATLDEEENEYVALIHQLRDDLVKRYGFDGALKLSGLEFVRHVSQMAMGTATAYKSDGADVLPERVFASVFMHIGYTVSRTQRYMRNCGKQAATSQLAVDVNDMEDAAILLHLDLTIPRTLVTADTGTITAYREAVAHLMSASEDIQTPVAIHTALVDPVGFKQQIIGAQ